MFDCFHLPQQIPKTINHLIEFEMKLAVVVVVMAAAATAVAMAASASNVSGIGLVCIN
jgi:hypothetical protein